MGRRRWRLRTCPVCPRDTVAPPCTPPRMRWDLIRPLWLHRRIPLHPLKFSPAQLGFHRHQPFEFSSLPEVPSIRGVTLRQLLPRQPFEFSSLPEVPQQISVPRQRYPIGEASEVAIRLTSERRGGTCLNGGGRKMKIVVNNSFVKQCQSHHHMNACIQW